MEQDSSSTLTDVASAERAKRARNVRRAGIGLLVAVVLVGASGVLDRTVDTQVTGESADISVTHPRFVRPGTEFELTVKVPSAASGFTLVVPISQISVFGVENMWPEPDDEVVRDGQLHLTFNDSNGQVLFNGRTDPSQPPGRHALDLELADTGLTYSAKVWVLP